MRPAWAVLTSLAAAMLPAAVPIAADGPPSVALGFDEPVQRALADLRAGRWDQAAALAEQLARNADQPQQRAWAIVAAARQNQQSYAAAAEAWRRFLGTCDSAALRQYAAGQLAVCQSQPPLRSPPSSTGGQLSEQLAALATVEERLFVQTGAHIVVQSHNEQLSALVLRQAEQALAGITRPLLRGAEYPHTVLIVVYATAKDYAADGSGGDWSNGRFELAAGADGQVRRMIHLTQLNAEGRFDTAMLDRVLPHELCHLVLTEWFGDAPCPLYLQEGLAMLAEAGEQSSRLLLAGSAVASSKAISLGELLSQEQCEADDRTMFYAEAFSFVAYLHQRLSGDQFAQMLAEIKAGHTMEESLHRALGMAHDRQFMDMLETAWRQDAVEQAQMLTALKQSGSEAF